MLKKSFIGLLAVAALALPALAADSGLSVGDKVPVFHPNHVTGPDAGTTKCPPCTYGERPAVQVWVRGDSSENVTKIAGLLNDLAKGDENFKAFMIFISDDTEKIKAKLEKVAKENDFGKIAMAYLAPDDKAIEAYKINLADDVKNTVFIYRDKKVAAKFVNLQADEQGIAGLNEAVAKVINK